jgi:octaprenyl-diphosphate synthase
MILQRARLHYLIYLYEALETEEKQHLLNLHKKTINAKSAQWISEMMDRHNIVTKCYIEAKELIEEAITLMRAEGEESLEQIATAMIDRSF